MAEENRHGCLVLLGTRGVFITGASGSGKSALAMDLIDQWKLAGRFAALVSDDRVLVRRTAAGALIGRAPEPIAGLVEIRGFGIRPIPREPHAVIDLQIDLVPAAELERLPERQNRHGIDHIEAPACRIIVARQLVAAALERLKSGL